MLKLCKFSIVALHLLLITHTAHTFVLLTANIDDVKQIARKFVSDELAEKIADFIARATETFAQQPTNPVEELFKDNSQVSAENRMYNIKRHGFEKPNVYEGKSKEDGEEGDDGKDEIRSTNMYKMTKAKTDTTPKPKKQVKSRSRYIVESGAKETTEKRSEEDKYKQLNEAINDIEHNLVAATTKSQTEKKKSTVKPYQLLNNYDSDDSDIKDGSSDSEEKETKVMRHRSFADEEIVLTGKPASQNENLIKKPVMPIERGGPENNRNENTKKNRETEMSRFLVQENDANVYKKPNREIESVFRGTENDGNVYANENRVMQKTGSLVKENDDDNKWWEKELPRRHNQDNTNVQKKSWF